MTCMVSGCPTFIPPGKVACSFHWSLVPKDLKLRLWSVYEDTLGPSAWQEAITAAAVAAKLGDLRKVG
jgi:hypothetical protein